MLAMDFFLYMFSAFSEKILYGFTLDNLHTLIREVIVVFYLILQHRFYFFIKKKIGPTYNFFLF